MRTIEKLDIEPFDIYIPIGDCRPTYWLKKFNLRRFSFPLDWISNIKLKTINILLKNNFSNFLADTEEIIEKNNPKSPYRYIYDKTYSFDAIHHFAKETPTIEQKEKVVTKYKKRGFLLKFLITHSKKICFISHYPFELNEFKPFTKEFKETMKKPFTLINIDSSLNIETNDPIIDEHIIDNCRLINIKFNDIYDGDNQTLAWTGNQKIQEMLFSKLQLTNRFYLIESIRNFHKKLKKTRIFNFLKKIFNYIKSLKIR